MNEYHSENGRIHLFNMDCMEYMAQFPDNYFELAIVDPPYGINAPRVDGGKTGKKRLNNGGGKLKNRILNNASCNWDSSIPDDVFFIELMRVSKNQIIWGGNYFDLPPTRCVIAWDKCQPWANFSQVELAWTSFDKPAPLFKFDNRTGGKIHPTQKPIELYEWVLSRFSNDGDKILDTHLGSASSAIAAHRMGFVFFGTELDSDYFNASIARFERETAQLDMFAEVAE